MLKKASKNLFECLNVIFEPTVACNLRCRHCYQAKTEYDVHRMSLETLDAFIEKCAPHFRHVKIIWHGGEPLLMGHEVYREAYERFRIASRRFGTEFGFSLQTNGTLLDEEYLEIFSENQTHASISYDGRYNDFLRQETGKTEAAIALLKERGVDFSCLSVISSASVNHLIDLYEYFKEKEISVKINPVYIDGAASLHREIAIKKEEWAEKFIELFDYWFHDEDCNICFQSCEIALRRALGKGNVTCLGTCMFSYLAIDAYGNLYPCGRMMNEVFKLGNIHDLEDDIREVFLSPNYLDLLKKNEKRAEGCAKCKWFAKCHSGCNAAAFVEGDLGRPCEFDCYFNRRVFAHIEKILQTGDQVTINPFAKAILESK